MKGIYILAFVVIVTVHLSPARSQPRSFNGMPRTSTRKGSRPRGAPPITRFSFSANSGNTNTRTITKQGSRPAWSTGRQNNNRPRQKIPKPPSPSANFNMQQWNQPFIKYRPMADMYLNAAKHPPVLMRDSDTNGRAVPRSRPLLSRPAKKAAPTNAPVVTEPPFEAPTDPLPEVPAPEALVSEQAESAPPDPVPTEAAPAPVLEQTVPKPQKHAPPVRVATAPAASPLPQNVNQDTAGTAPAEVKYAAPQPPVDPPKPSPANTGSKPLQAKSSTQMQLQSLTASQMQPEPPKQQPSSTPKKSVPPPPRPPPASLNTGNKASSKQATYSVFSSWIDAPGMQAPRGQATLGRATSASEINYIQNKNIFSKTSVGEKRVSTTSTALAAAEGLGGNMNNGQNVVPSPASFVAGSSNTDSSGNRRQSSDSQIVPSNEAPKPKLSSFTFNQHRNQQGVEALNTRTQINSVPQQSSVAQLFRARNVNNAQVTGTKNQKLTAPVRTSEFVAKNSNWGAMAQVSSGNNLGNNNNNNNNNPSTSNRYDLADRAGQGSSVGSIREPTNVAANENGMSRSVVPQTATYVASIERQSQGVINQKSSSRPLPPGSKQVMSNTFENPWNFVSELTQNGNQDSKGNGNGNKMLMENNNGQTGRLSQRITKGNFLPPRSSQESTLKSGSQQNTLNTFVNPWNFVSKPSSNENQESKGMVAENNRAKTKGLSQGIKKGISSPPRSPQDSRNQQNQPNSGNQQDLGREIYKRITSELGLNKFGVSNHVTTVNDNTQEFATGTSRAKVQPNSWESNQGTTSLRKVSPAKMLQTDNGGQNNRATTGGGPDQSAQNEFNRQDNPVSSNTVAAGNKAMRSGTAGQTSQSGRNFDSPVNQFSQHGLAWQENQGGNNFDAPINKGSQNGLAGQGNQDGNYIDAQVNPGRQSGFASQGNRGGNSDSGSGNQGYNFVEASRGGSGGASSVNSFDNGGAPPRGNSINSFDNGGAVPSGSSINSFDNGGAPPRGNSINSFDNGGAAPGGSSINSFDNSEAPPHGNSINSFDNSGAPPRGNSINSFDNGGAPPRGSSINSFDNGGAAPRGSSINSFDNGGAIPSGSSINSFDNGGAPPRGNSINSFDNGGTPPRESSINSFDNGGAPPRGNSINSFDNGGAPPRESSINSFDNGGAPPRGNSINSFDNGGAPPRGNSINSFDNGGAPPRGSSINSFDNGGAAPGGSSINSFDNGGAAPDGSSTNSFDNGGAAARDVSNNAEGQTAGGSGIVAPTGESAGPVKKPCNVAPVCGSDGFTYMSECFIWTGTSKACDGFCPCSNKGPSQGPPPSSRQAPPPSNSQGSLPPNKQGPPPVNRQGPPPQNRQGSPPVNRQGPPQNRQGPPPANRQGPPPANRQGPPPANRQGLPPQNRQGSPPANRQGPPPPNRQGPPPANRQGPPPANRQGPPPANRQGPPPANRQGPPPQIRQGLPPMNRQGPPPPNRQGPPPANRQGPPLPSRQGPPPPNRQGQPPANRQGPPPPNRQGQPPNSRQWSSQNNGQSQSSIVRQGPPPPRYRHMQGQMGGPPSPLPVNDQASSGPQVSDVPPTCSCPTLYRPVCSVRGRTYDNDCLRRCNYDGFKCQGECPCGKNSKRYQSNDLARPDIGPNAIQDASTSTQALHQATRVNRQRQQNQQSTTRHLLSNGSPQTTTRGLGPDGVPVQPNPTSLPQTQITTYGRVQSTSTLAQDPRTVPTQTSKKSSARIASNVSSNGPEAGVLTSEQSSTRQLSNKPRRPKAQTKKEKPTVEREVIEREVIEGGPSGGVSMGGASQCYCNDLYAPVCGTDGITYTNPCDLSCSGGVGTACNGQCPCGPFFLEPVYFCEDYCSRAYQPVCSSWGHTFENECLRECSNEAKDCNGECPCQTTQAQYDPQPNQYNNQPAPYEPQLNQYNNQPAPYEPQPNTNVNQPAPYEPQADQYANQPAPYDPQTNQYANQPAPYDPQTSQYGNQPGPYDPHGNQYSTDPNNYNREPSNQPLSTCECMRGDIDPVCTTLGETLWYGCQAICRGVTIACSSECPC